MTKLKRSEVFNTGKIIANKEESKSFIKQVGTINNQFIDLKIVNAMVEENIYLNIVDNKIKQSHIQKLKSKRKHLQIRIILQGKLEKLNHHTNEKRVYEKNEISIEYEKNIEESLLNKQGQHLKYICITLHDKYLNENGFFSDILKNTFNKKIYEPNLEDKFSELFNREYKSGLDKIYLKNKAMQIILYVLEEIQKRDELKFVGLNDEDIKRVKKVENIIQNSFNEKITIEILSKRVALNQTKLKKGFKELFNKTIHEYLKDVRLEKAVEYLKEDIYSIKEISSMVGYTNQGSFSYAFSQKFNCSPKDIQKNSIL
ncbi:AraC family transcriptional regulator [Halarcobacter ebronensis]|uniref:HTH araC/xylS-type domain-containing protein n=1 Tax=Halarcobacter ebronensis TaxID=1462615 RepID=A0A4Q1AWL2_9BACT|nr:AraC family transcriptional regulator [Halarcobacter ebronensis]QKF82828.1 transcriptional regulator, AraC family [Halarcobacter ebronensis]RXK06849.1 hypothetical protein CRV07_05310 [Halarcobacter ebronensis]